MKAKKNAKDITRAKTEKQLVMVSDSDFKKLIFKNDTYKQMQAITRGDDSINNFCCIKELESGKKIIKDFRDNIDNLYSRLLVLNKQGFCVYVVVNKCVGDRSDKNISKVRATFFDDDDNQDLKFPIKPNMLVQSARGLQGYYFIKDVFPVDEFTATQKSIARYFKTDPTVCNPSRLMRVAGFAHVKDIKQPKPVRLIHLDENCYTANEIKNVFADSKNKTHNNNLVFGDAQLNDFESWCKNLPRSEGADNVLGGRNKTALMLVREGLGRGVSREVIADMLSEYCQSSGLPHSEVAEMLSRQEAEHSVKKFSAFFDKSSSSKNKITTAQLAEKYLALRGFVNDQGKSVLAYWRNNFSIYCGTHYKKIPLNDLRADIAKFIRESDELRDLFRRSWIDDIVVYLMGIKHISASTQVGCDLKMPDQKNNFIFLKNSVLSLVKERNYKVVPLKHDMDYFSFVSLPYNYNPKADCPIFTKTIKEIIPDKQTRDFLQEWFGYNLIHDTSQSKLVILVGEGANGKTVVLSSLTALLGRENISAVALESFSATRTFPLAATIGKLANIVDEIGNVKGVEAILKQYVSGSTMNVETKGVDGTDQMPTARLTFATNHVPAFQDRSDGIWRRLIIVPMEVQILDEAKQNKNLSRVEFWQNSGEVEGILNWAIEGLQRLMRRGYFVEPEKSKQYKKSFRHDCDPLANFIEEHLSVGANSVVGATTLYQLYTAYASENKLSIVSPAMFVSAIKQAFPMATKSQNPTVIRGKKNRERVWTGISCNYLGFESQGSDF